MGVLTLVAIQLGEMVRIESQDEVRAPHSSGQADQITIFLSDLPMQVRHLHFVELATREKVMHDTQERQLFGSWNLTGRSCILKLVCVINRTSGGGLSGVVRRTLGFIQWISRERTERLDFYTTIVE